MIMVTMTAVSALIMVTMTAVSALIMVTMTAVSALIMVMMTSVSTLIMVMMTAVSALIMVMMTAVSALIMVTMTAVSALIMVMMTSVSALIMVTSVSALIMVTMTRGPLPSTCAEKALVHEWAHFRWGVFDEYGLPGEPQFYFSPKTGNLSGVRCTELIQGIIRLSSPAPGQNPYCREVDPATGLYPEGCVFLPYPAGPQVTGVQASVMDHVYIRPVSCLSCSCC